MTNEELVMKIKAGEVAISQQKGSIMKIAEIRKMVMIPEERYDRMLESYDKAVNTTGKLVKEVSAMQAELDRRTIIENEAILLISKCRFLEAMELLATI